MNTFTTQDLAAETAVEKTEQTEVETLKKHIKLLISKGPLSLRSRRPRTSMMRR